MVSARDLQSSDLCVRIGPEAFTKHVGGVRRSAIELTAALRSCNVSVEVAQVGLAGVDLASDNVPGSRRISLRAAEFVFAGRPDSARRTGVHHALYYDAVLSTRSWPVVATVHDMIHELLDVGSRSLRLAKRFAVHQARLIVTPSESASRDLRRLLDPSCEIAVIPHGVASALLNAVPDEAPSVLGPYLLFVGSRSGYKNLDLLVRTIDDCRCFADLGLVLVGGGPLTEAEGSQLQLALGGRVPTHVDAASDAELATLYRYAAALVVPSRYEGFGLPVLEAMALDCPVACSNGGSLPEVSAGHAALFSPDSTTECRDAIERAIDMPADARCSAREYARSFTWERSAAAHVGAYAGVLSGQS